MNRSIASLLALALAVMAAALPMKVPADDAGRKEGSVAAAKPSDFPGIQKLMPPEEFSRAGLDKLTPEQVRALDDWLVRYTAGEAYVVQTTSEEVRAAVPEFSLEARIVPPFNGWSGQTLFRLDNGQVWRQRIKGRYMFSGDDTRVVITRNLLGFYNMTLVSSGRAVGVEPVRKPDQGRASD
jgi:hypothetical protein